MSALSHITILDLTHMLSGPYASQLLADMGAHCIKVEPPGRGEGTRKLLADDEKYSIDGVGAYFLTLSRNKKSVAIDLKKPAGLSLFYELVKKADVVINNFGAGVPKRLGIDYEVLKQHNPRIITCSITGFGETGPDRDRAAFDLVAQGMGGGMSITGEEGAPPLRAGIPIGGLGGGLFAAIGILAALNQRDQSPGGRGQHVDISMQDCQVSMLNYMATMYLMSGQQPPAVGNNHFVHVPYGTFKTRTRYLILACMGDAFFGKLATMFNDPELMDPKFSTQPVRWEHRHFINTRVQQHIGQETCEHWLERLKEHRIPAAPVNDFEHALSDPQIMARDMVVEVPLGNDKTVKQPGNPVKLSSQSKQAFTSPPALGQHTNTVLSELLQMNDSQIAQLRQNGVIG
ncbi:MULTISPECIES: CaiB/BaiF CoA transferase family protein [unclassified Ketobacter]|uniref:CaiB/BaiF CoA transferase family protein n=1 Tax=unclassified Ketobacter TaxID=2639109 RepID=UPI000F2AD2DF|nr:MULTISPECIES: CaiB/BaiF CoA-transferase family protein [unclassified Ketobacter]RLT89475.1 MAG: CoA transferase [Ketobacter sp. GenoA1]RLT94971.1 MAG: CoA transferase [Ketobacter sp.]